MERYEPLKIEEKWQKRWEEEKPFKAEEKDGVPKMYLAEMFPYPSGAGLHVGHVRNFTIVDVLTRFYTQQKLNVMRPFGYDTFGLPAENYAIKPVSLHNLLRLPISQLSANRLSVSVMPLTGIAKSTLQIRTTITGLSGASFNSSKKA